MRRVILLGVTALSLATGCTNRMEAVGQVDQPTGRMYSTHVQPVTGSPKCVECHTTDSSAASAPKGLGAYSVDKLYPQGLRTMLTDARYAKNLFTEEEIKNVLDWLDAGRRDAPRERYSGRRGISTLSGFPLRLSRKTTISSISCSVR